MNRGAENERPMGCGEVLPWLDDLAADDLPAVAVDGRDAPPAAVLHAHLRDCMACRRAFRAALDAHRAFGSELREARESFALDGGLDRLADWQEQVLAAVAEQAIEGASEQAIEGASELGEPEREPTSAVPLIEPTRGRAPRSVFSSRLRTAMAAAALFTIGLATSLWISSLAPLSPPGGEAPASADVLSPDPARLRGTRRSAPVPDPRLIPVSLRAPLEGAQAAEGQSGLGAQRAAEEIVDRELEGGAWTGAGEGVLQRPVLRHQDERSQPRRDR